MKGKGLIIDLDDTLVDSEQAYRLALKSVGISNDSERYSIARQTVKERLGLESPASHNRLLYFKELARQNNSWQPLDLMTQMHTYESALTENIRQQWEDLKRDKLMRRISTHYKLLILTNENTRTQLLKLNAMDPQGKWFCHLLSSEELGVEKPASLAFEKAMNLLNLPASDCIAIGNNFKSDLEPALKMGMNAILTTEFTHSPLKDIPENAVTVLKKLDELIQVLQ